MTPPCTPAEALDRDGYVVVAGALDEAWVERLRRAFTEAPQPNGTQHVAVTAETPELESWNALRAHPALVAAAAHVLGISFEVRELHGRNPLPGYGQQGLHADDVPRATVEPYFVFTAIWMFDDFTVENGATRIVPGSHRLLGAVPKGYAQPLASHPEERIVTGGAGSVVLFNGHAWHSGTKNRTTGSRRAGQMVVRRGPQPDGSSTTKRAPRS